MTGPAWELVVYFARRLVLALVPGQDQRRQSQLGRDGG